MALRPITLRSRGEISCAFRPNRLLRRSACAFDRAATVRERLRTFETFGHLIVSRPLSYAVSEVRQRIETPPVEGLGMPQFRAGKGRLREKTIEFFAGSLRGS